MVWFGRWLNSQGCAFFFRKLNVSALVVTGWKHVPTCLSQIPLSLWREHKPHVIRQGGYRNVVKSWVTSVVGTETGKGWSLCYGCLDVFDASKILPVEGGKLSHPRESWCDARGLVTGFHSLLLWMKQKWSGKQSVCQLVSQSGWGCKGPWGFILPNPFA